MQGMFTLNVRDMIRLRKFFQVAPRAFARSISSTLNDVAFGVRRENLAVINREMIVRNPRFVESRIKVEKSRLNQGGQMHSIVGSILSPRFSGWTEQETGKESDRHRALTIMARKGDIRKQAASYARLKGGDIITSYQAGLGSVKRIYQQYAFVQLLTRNKWRKPFILGKSWNHKAGLLRLKGGKVERLQSFGENLRPKRVKWMQKGISKYIQGNRIATDWAKNVYRELARY